MKNPLIKKIQVGYTPEKVKREEGERWTDHKGLEWEWKSGKKKQVYKFASVGIAPKCKDCNKFIIKKRDKETYNRMDRCYYCQINFEVDLKEKGEWNGWMVKQETERWKSIEKELVSILEEMKTDTDKAFDKTLPNALANENIERAKRENEF